MEPGRNGRGFETPNLERETPGILQRISEEGGYAFVRMMAAAGGGACGEPRAAEAAREMAWEQLHCGPWHSVLPIWRDAYSMACLYVAKHHFAAGEFSETLRALDMGLIMGGLLLKPDLEAAVERVMAAAKERENGGVGDKFVGNSSCRLFNPSLFSEAEVLRLLPEKSLSSKKVERRSGLSLEGFLQEHYQSGSPVIIGDAMSHWPATTRWNNMDYLKRVAGDRTVPVEVGKNYLSPEWKQELITFTQFLERIQPSSSSAAPTYLAQHPLFDQIKELRKDIRIPDYCYTGGGELRSVNAWFGPAGTVTPLHHDPHHNILAQVVGKKYVRLYAASISEELYPHSETMLCNSSQLAQLVKYPGVVTRDLGSNPAISSFAPPFTCRRKMKKIVDLDNIDDVAFPKVKDLEFLDCILDEGEMLYIPPKWWHYIRSLTTSLSVSFWWSNPEGSP